MAVSVKQVEALNEKIEKLNTSRTQTETRKEILTQNLSKKLEEYKEKYGVDLRGGKFVDTFKKIQAEAKAVSAKVEEEFNLKQQVVEAIEGGDIAEANRLLGIEEVEEDAGSYFDEEEDIKEDEFESLEEDEQEEDDFPDPDYVPEDEKDLEPIADAVKGLSEKESNEEEGVEDVFGGLHISADDLVEEGDPEEDDDEFNMGDFLGEQFK